MSMDFLKRNLAFYLSIAALSGNYTFAGKKNMDGKKKFVKPKFEKTTFSKKLLKIEVPKKNKKSTSNFLQLNFGQPNFLQLNLRQPNLFQPNLFQPNLFQPNLFQPNLFQPNLFQPNLSQPNLSQPNLSQQNSETLKSKGNKKSSTNIFNSRLVKDHELPGYFHVMYNDGNHNNTFSVLCSPKKLKISFNSQESISKKLPLEKLLPCQNIRNSYYPLLLASLLRLAEFIIEPMEPPFRLFEDNNKGYYLSHARKYFSSSTVQIPFTKRERLVSPTIEEQEEDKNISENLKKLFENEYTDESSIKWSAKTLVYLTILLAISSHFSSPCRLDVLTNFAKSENIVPEYSEKLIRPLLDHITGKIQRDKIPDFYKRFYLDILQTIDPKRKDDFKLLEPFNIGNNMGKVSLDKKSEFKVQNVDSIKFS